MEFSATARLLTDVLGQELDQPPGELRQPLGRLVVLDDGHDLAEALLSCFEPESVRVHSDRLTTQRWLTARLGDRPGLDVADRLSPALFDGAQVVALDLPTDRARLAETARLAALAGCPLLLGVGRDRHMSPTMNTALGQGYRTLRASRGRQKSRVLIARDPRRDVQADFGPRCRELDGLGLTVCARPGVFAGPRLDAGTRLLLGTSDRWPRADRIIDLGCGTGVLAVRAAQRCPEAAVLALDESAAACDSARSTAEANGLGERIDVRRADGLSAEPDATADLIVCNPPFHVGTAKESTPAIRMLTDAGRVLVADGELWTVANTHLPYRDLLRREVGPTEIVTQDRGYLVLRTRVRRTRVQGLPRH